MSGLSNLKVVNQLRLARAMAKPLPERAPTYFKQVTKMIDDALITARKAHSGTPELFHSGSWSHARRLSKEVLAIEQALRAASTHQGMPLQGQADALEAAMQLTSSVVPGSLLRTSSKIATTTSNRPLRRSAATAVEHQLKQAREHIGRSGATTEQGMRAIDEVRLATLRAELAQEQQLLQVARGEIRAIDSALSA